MCGNSSRTSSPRLADDAPHVAKDVGNRRRQARAHFIFEIVVIVPVPLQDMGGTCTQPVVRQRLPMILVGGRYFIVGSITENSFIAINLENVDGKLRFAVKDGALISGLILRTKETQFVVKSSCLISSTCLVPARTVL